MKELFSNFILLIVLSVAFSGCGAGSGDDPRPGSDVTQRPANSAPAEGPKKNSEYPPIAATVANADVKNLDGSTFKVADKKGKVLLLNMWATWCGPCRAEMPALVRMHETHGPQGFEVIGLNTDDEPVELINKFAGEMKLNYPLVWADTQMQNALVKISNFGGIPQSFLIDRDGKLRGVFKGGAKPEIEKMEELVTQVVAE